MLFSICLLPVSLTWKASLLQTSAALTAAASAAPRTPAPRSAIRSGCPSPNGAQCGSRAWAPTPERARAWPRSRSSARTASVSAEPLVGFPTTAHLKLLRRRPFQHACVGQQPRAMRRWRHCAVAGRARPGLLRRRRRSRHPSVTSLQIANDHGFQRPKCAPSTQPHPQVSS